MSRETTNIRKHFLKGVYRMDINYELYKVFYHVANTLSFSEASKQLYISQSAVSQSIRTLENKMDARLFYRSTKRVSLTPAGELLYSHIAPAMTLIARGEHLVLDHTNLGQLHIAASDTICRYFLVPYFKQFHDKFPNIPIKVTNATSLGCVELLEQGTVDLIVTNSPNSRLNPSYIQKTVLSFDEVFIANSAYYDLTDREISFLELQNYPILMLNRKSTTSEYLHQIFLQHQLELRPAVELSSNDLLIDLAKIGLGIAFVPSYCLSSSDHNLFRLKTKEGIPARQLAVSVNPSIPISESTQEFLQLLPEIE